MSESIDVTRLICALADITNPGARAFTAGPGEWPLRGFVVRHGELVRAYVNRCPHAGHPLNWRPDQFLTADQSLILCSSHGAVFEIDGGACVAGPCVGRSLRPIGVHVHDGFVILDADPEKLAEENS